MFTLESEKKFFLSHLSKNQKVLEYGSGESTLEICKYVKELISIEHQDRWFSKLNPKIPKNCKLFLEKPNLNYEEGGHCGTYEEFQNYIEKPLEFAPYDIILIDGRARVGCSSICNRLSHDNTIIFIHDFERIEYVESLKYLSLVDMVDKMAKLVVKK
jgi:hypothetical protein